MSAYEVNFDGLIGPSHNYGGLSDGNLASATHAGAVSNPREAALQGLEKMRALFQRGLIQGVLPPLPRPNFDFLVSAGFHGTDAQIIESAARVAPHLLKAAYSASNMWTANAATVSPSADTADGRLHLTTANLSTMLHRSIEHPDTTATLITLFDNEDRFSIHSALPMHSDFADEGAANHVRLCAEHSAMGVELFVYGREVGESTFHNDVVCVGALDTLFFHELAFEDTRSTLDAIRRAADGLFELKPVMVSNADVPIADAIKSYLFNSQLLQMPGQDRLVLVAPIEAQEMESTRAFCEGMVAGNGPIGHVEFVDVRQSMRNGGGPACLRLRVVITELEIDSCHQGVLLDDEAIDELQDVVRTTYRDRLAPSDLADPAFADECRAAREGLLAVLDLESLA